MTRANRSVGGTALRCAGVAALVAAWSSSGATPLRDAVNGARAPTDFATDFVPAARIGQPSAAGVRAPTALDVETGNRASAALGVPPYAAVGVPFGAHPPPAVLLVAALVPLGFRGAAMAWLLVSLLGLALIAWTASGALAAHGRQRMLLAIGGFAALTLWPPVLHNIEKGQWSALIAGLLAGAWWAHTRQRDRLAGTLVALAACFKVMPLLVVISLLAGAADRRRRVLTGAAATLVVAGAASTVIMGPAAWGTFLTSAPVNTAGWQTGPANTLSVWGALARLLIGGPYAQPVALVQSHPALGLWAARLLWLAAACASIAMALRLTFSLGRRARADAAPTSAPAGPSALPVPAPPDEQPAAAAYAAWCGLAVLLGPLSWSHAASLLVLPLTLLAGRLGQRRGLTVASPAAAVGLAAAAIMLTIPRATLFRWAGSLPVTPASGMFLTIHLAAVLILVAVALRRRHPGGVAYASISSSENGTTNAANIR